MPNPTRSMKTVRKMIKTEGFFMSFKSAVVVVAVSFGERNHRIRGSMIGPTPL